MDKKMGQRSVAASVTTVMPYTAFRAKMAGWVCARQEVWRSHTNTGKTSPVEPELPVHLTYLDAESAFLSSQTF